MKAEITVSEVIEIFNEIHKKPEALFEMIRLDLRKLLCNGAQRLSKTTMPN
jgi:hypothetical protein